MASDTELLQAWADGDNEAGQALVGRYVAAVYRFFRNKAPREMEDLSQRTFLALLKTRGGPGAFGAFARTAWARRATSC